MSPPVGNGEDDGFERVMEMVGMEGRFQRRFNLLFNMSFSFLFAMPTFNILMALTVPPHWCHVPGRNETNFTIQQWKSLTLPVDVDGLTYSKCEMYNVSDSDRGGSNMTTRHVTSCQYGWEYDTTWYKLTVPSQQDWVCNKDLYVTNAIFFCRAGEAVGTLILGQLADLFGRRPIMLLSIVILVVGRTLTAFTSSIYYLFLAVGFLGNTPTAAVFMSPLIIGVEVSAPKDRAHIAMLQFIGWVSGICAVPLLAWVTGGDWRVFMMVTTLPCLAMFLALKWFPESPRWLASVGKAAECEKVLRQISRVNGRELPDEAVRMLHELDHKKENVYGVLSLFSSWRFAKNTCLVSCCTSLCHLVYFSLIILVTSMSGNPFLNFFMQAVIEYPGMILGRIGCDRLGRRWCQAMAYTMAGICCFIISNTVTHPELQWLQTGMVVSAKFFITMNLYAAYLLTTEMYPTCVRQTGSSTGFVASAGFGLLVPYITYLGPAVGIQYPYMVLTVLALLGVLSALCLPETLNKKLPETLADAAIFGKDQKFWSFPERQVRSQSVPTKEKHLKNGDICDG